MRTRLTTLVLLVAAFSGGMWTWRTIHFMTYHGPAENTVRTSGR
jgi:hypothetical protein